MKYEVAQCKLHPGEWLVEGITDHGEIYMVRFSGNLAEERARDYADWQNGAMPT